MTGKIASEAKRETGTGTDLWRVLVAPIIWAVHFLFCYVYGAVYCAKFGRDAPLLDVRIAVALATAVALVGLGLATRHLWGVRGSSITNNDYEFEHDTPEERHRFLSHVALMLCVLSAVAVIYVAIPAAYLTSCR
jgi:hypothetical protein